MYRKIIKVFLGSPGDLEEERKVAKLIVDEENLNHANQSGYHIELVGWEDTVSQRRRAQDAINVDLDQCEYFVGLLWKKWGTPPGTDGHPYSSGFEEEFRRSVDRYESTDKPKISLLFKNIPEDDLSDVGQQLEKVLAFRKEIDEEKKQYYQKFQDLRDFERRFRAIIAKILKDEQIEDSKSEPRQPQQPRPSVENNKNRENDVNQSTIFESSALIFLQEFIGKERVGNNAFNAVDVARFRLLACSVSQSGNDIPQLGTHDANLIFRELRNAKLSKRERRGLLSTALASYGSSTVPLWHWLFAPDFHLEKELPLLTLAGEEKLRCNAFKILEKLSISPSDFEDTFNKTTYLQLWFSEEKSDELIIAALDYLGAVGDVEIEVDWAHFIGSSEANISRTAIRSRARIIARTSTAEALRFVAEHESTDLGGGLTKDLLTNINTIETVVLRNCLNNRTEAFLRVVATELFDRAALTQTDVQLLCKSADAEIRLIGVRALAKLNPNLTLSEAREILVNSRKSSSDSLLPSPQFRDYQGEEAFEEYKIRFLGALPFDVLIHMQEKENLFSNEATLALYFFHYKRTKSQLENNLLDGFEKFIARRHAEFEDSVPEPSDEIYIFMKENLLQSALEAYCSGAAKADLATVRMILDKYDIRFSSEISEFLSKHGEWEDIFRLVKLSGKLKYAPGFSLFSIVDHTEEYNLIAKAILKLGAKRIADVWGLNLPNLVRKELVSQIPKKLFLAFDDHKIINMLLWNSDIVRETVAIKTVLCLPKRRLRRILDAYFKVDDSYYYNVIFWLDLGISADRDTSRAVALREIAAK